MAQNLLAWKPITVLLGAALLAAGCGALGAHGNAALAPRGPAALGVAARAASTSATGLDRSPGGVAPDRSLGGVALDPARLDVEDVEKQARARATAWQSDARLVCAGWGVVKWELLSVVALVFYSKKADKVLVVQNYLRQSWQRADEFSSAAVVAPARALPEVAPYRIDSHRALEIARTHWLDPRPVSIGFLIRVPRLKAPVWVFQGDGTLVGIDATSGASVAIEDYKAPPREWESAPEAL